MTEPQLRISDWLRAAAEACGNRLDAELLAARALGRSRAWLYGHGSDVLTPREHEDLDALLARRKAGEPIAYIEGVREFYGREFEVGPSVLIPRPETEHLVDFALETDLPDDARVADIGTGSGCILLSLALERPNWRCVGVDLSPDALDVARGNCERLGADTVELLQGDLLAPLAGRRFDLIVSNPPYVTADDPHLDKGDLRFEPRMALTPGGDGLDIIRRLIESALDHLTPDGWLALEHGYDQAERVQALMREARYRDVRSVRDLAGIERISVGRAGG